MSARPVMTFGAPTVGEILAERYQLERARQQRQRGPAGLARGRRHPAPSRRGGAAPPGWRLRHRDAAGRGRREPGHPPQPGRRLRRDRRGRAGVRGPRVGRRRVAARAGRAEGPLDPARATAIAHAIADALAAVHATGMVHGNVHPGTVLIGDDGRVVLADARADGADSHRDRRPRGRRHPLLRAHRSLAARRGAGATAGHGRDAIPDASDAAAHRRAPAGPGRRPGVPRRPDHGPARQAESRRPTSDVLAAELARLDVRPTTSY